MRFNAGYFGTGPVFQQPVLIYNHPMPEKTEPTQNNLRVGLILLFVFLFMAGYYVIHKPITPETGSALGMSLWRVFTAAYILLLAGTIGRRLGVNIPDNQPASVVIQAGLGLGILSIYILLAGSTSGINVSHPGYHPAGHAGIAA